MSTIEKSIPVRTRVKNTFVRFNISQRIEHALLIVSFTVLAVTGLPQKFFESPFSLWLINNVFGGIDMTRGIHRFFAAVLILESVYHVATWFVYFGSRRRRPEMLPVPKDIGDLTDQVSYFFGKRKRPAEFGRYDFRQKFEYWGLVWGTAIMAITGLIMWFPVDFTRLLSGDFVLAARAAHGGEAILAVLTIVVWHMYSAHLNPDVFPFDKSIFTGKVSRHQMEYEHPIELLEIEQAEAAQRPPVIEKLDIPDK